MEWIRVALAVAVAATQEERPLALSGTESKINRSVYLQIRSPEEWEEFWREHTGTHERPPELDFGKSTVLALVQGIHRIKRVDPPSVDEKDGVVRLMAYAFCDPQDLGKADETTAYWIAEVPRLEKPHEMWFGYYVWGQGCNGYEAIASFSPLGNGVLVFFPKPQENLFAFFSATGKRISRVPVAEEDGKLRRPTVGLPFERAYSPDGFWLILTAPRKLRILLPVGRPLDERLKTQIAALLDPPKLDLDGLVDLLRDPRIEVRDRATRELAEKAFHHLGELERAARDSEPELRTRIEAVLRELTPLKVLAPLAKDPKSREALRKFGD